MAQDYRFFAATRRRCFALLFEHRTRSGRRMETFWIAASLLSVVVLFFESSASDLFPNTPDILWRFGLLELGFTALFSVEYVLRVLCSPRKTHYPVSFFGIIDLCTVLPMYILWMMPSLAGATDLVVLVRLLRVLRVLRVLKLLRYMNDAGILWRSLMRARRKLSIFFGFVAIILCLFGGLMFAVEEGKDGFTSLGASVYWAVVTLTTVGYGDITPHTATGRMLASILILLGYSIIAVPTGILTAYMSQELEKGRAARSCQNCLHSGHESDAKFCAHCGAVLDSDRSQPVDK
ncbi:potassium channel family protein [Rahnella inusitata]|jgi:voltage-gated potassium channel|uniref:Transporter n=2 Tax=Rahnella inusitata TaxID=58169 RepID=A0ABX9NWL7_9GAMM|nr:ion transporter [Rahnella inusitata]RJT09708.1 transporter [Rahnella inusitata]